MDFDAPTLGGEVKAVFLPYLQSTKKRKKDGFKCPKFT